MTDSAQRNYGGLSADERRARRHQEFLSAGLELLGTTGTSGLTVRGVLQRTRLAPRYFYEHFAGIDELAAAVFDRLVQEMVEAGLAAIADHGQGLRARIHDGLDAIARLLTDDPRKGRVLLIESMASPVLAPLRREAVRTVAALLAAQARETLLGDPGTIEITARFLVGGFSETLAALIQEPAHSDRAALIDRCTDLFLAATTQPSSAEAPLRVGRSQ